MTTVSNPSSKPIFFTDLDGTLLDHASYSYAPAASALEQLRSLDCPLVLASSKTGAEIAPLRAELGFAHCPAIVENGAGILAAGADPADDAEAYQRIRRVLAELAPEFSGAFVGFGDMTDAEVSDVTGLSLQTASLARQRCHSEPGLWSGDDATLARFLTALHTHGISARSGGRFLTLSFGRTKADAMRQVVEDYVAETTIALGDAPNDVEMIEAATVGIIVRNDAGTDIPELPGETTGKIRRTVLPGPSGWNAAVLGVIEELSLQKENTPHG